jgi:nucleoside-diphosphate-sugar epimerase
MVAMPVDEDDLKEVIERSAGDLRSLKGARIFITGGTGYIGRWLLEALRRADELLGLKLAIVILSRAPDRFASRFPHLATGPAVQLVAGDVRSFSVSSGSFSHAIHAAGDVVQERDALETFDVAISGTRRALEFCQARGVTDVLLLSSGAVYGPVTVDRVPEDYRGSPLSDEVKAAYGIGKLATEWLGTAYSGGGVMGCKSARVFAQVGPYLAVDRQFAVGNFIANALRQEPFVIRGDGTPVRSYMYATDLVAWLLAILVRGGPGRAYNVGSDQPISIRDLAAEVASVAGVKDPTFRVLGTTAQDALQERYVPDIARAKSELAVSLEVDFQDALRRTIDWYRRSASW